ncbi:FAD binding domain-containing protein [Elongatibacter sediminis]|uniref:FAD binding domain-containing protein n=1 Tax=Elongatibacter sediminis TaxID=3119006 RepID=A0AAW9R613_9GAMM
MTLNRLQHYHLPDSGNAVIDLLEKYPDEAMIVAGGTFVHGLAARGLVSHVEALIDVSRLGLNFVRTDEGRLWIGATTTFRELLESPEIAGQPLFGAIRDALSWPPPQVRNAATIGGCVAAACPFFDMPVALLALAGAVSAQGRSGVREVPLQEFYDGLFENTLKADEFVIDMSVPLPTGRAASAFAKLETNANDLAILNAAVLVSAGSGGTCDMARVFVGGGVGETPVRSRAAEEVLIGNALTAEHFVAAGEAARNEIDPLDDHRASAAYRKAMTAVYVQRVLEKAAARLRA